MSDQIVVVQDGDNGVNVVTEQASLTIVAVGQAGPPGGVAASDWAQYRVPYMVQLGQMGVSAGLTFDGTTLTATAFSGPVNGITLAGTGGSTLNVGTGGTLGTAAYTATSAYDAAGSAASAQSAAQSFATSAVSTHAALQTGIHGLAITAGKTLTVTESLTLSGTGGTTMTFPSTSATVARTDAGQTFTGVQVFSSTITGSISGNAATVTTNANLTGPITSVGNATSVALQTGTGSTFVMQASPTLTTPVLGVATATSINKVTLTAPVTGATLTIADGKTLTASNTLTLTATDGSTLAIGTGGTLGTAAYTATTAYEAAGSISTHAALQTGVHGISITAGKTLSVTESFTLGGTAGQTYTFPSASGTVATLNAANVFTATQTLPAGTVLVPSLTWGDSGTGPYRIGLNNIGFSVSGAKVLDIASTGLAVTGTLSSTGVLSVTDATDATSATVASLKTAGGIAAVKGLWIGGTSRLVGALTVDSIAALVTAAEAWIGPSSTTGVYFKSGNVGIGTAFPANADNWEKVIDVRGIAHAKSIVTTSGGIEAGVYSHDSGFFGALAGGMFGTRSNHPLSFITNSVSRVTIGATGDFGIGTTSPVSLTELQGGLTTAGAVLTLGTKEPTVVANDVLGRINFYAPLDTAGGDANLVGASIAAVAEGTFSATSNATKLSFATGSSEAATEKMTLSSAGALSVTGVLSTTDATDASNPTTAALKATGGAAFAKGVIVGGSQIALMNATNGQAMGVKTLTELTTIAAAASTDTTIQMPANSIILAVAVRVTTAITCTSTFTVGDSGSAARFSTAAVSKAVNSTDAGTKAGAYYNASALSVRITPDTVPSDATGRLRVVIYYVEVTAPTS